ncbi:MAG: hypothetical protein OXF79_17380 [Chloroflexi bacterium]|nr:hypothetical protein [Chloroflexota bacterium]
MANIKITQSVKAYFTDLRLMRGSGAAIDERSHYVSLINLLNAVGGALRPKVFCVQDLDNQGADHPVCPVPCQGSDCPLTSLMVCPSKSVASGSWLILAPMSSRRYREDEYFAGYTP